MHEIVLNCCYSLSKKAVEWLAAKEALVKDNYYFFLYEDDRTNPNLIKVVKELGSEASAHCSKLEIITSDSELYRITEYDGFESLETPEMIHWKKF